MCGERRLHQSIVAFNRSARASLALLLITLGGSKEAKADLKREFSDPKNEEMAVLAHLTVTVSHHRRMLLPMPPKR